MASLITQFHSNSRFQDPDAKFYIPNVVHPHKNFGLLNFDLAETLFYFAPQILFNTGAQTFMDCNTGDMKNISRVYTAFMNMVAFLVRRMGPGTIDPSGGKSSMEGDPSYFDLVPRVVFNVIRIPHSTIEGRWAGVLFIIGFQCKGKSISDELEKFFAHSALEESRLVGIVFGDASNNDTNGSNENEVHGGEDEPGEDEEGGRKRSRQRAPKKDKFKKKTRIMPWLDRRFYLQLCQSMFVNSVESSLVNNVGGNSVLSPKNVWSLVSACTAMKNSGIVHADYCTPKHYFFKSGTNRSWHYKWPGSGEQVYNIPSDVLCARDDEPCPIHRFYFPWVNRSCANNIERESMILSAISAYHNRSQSEMDHELLADVPPEMAEQAELIHEAVRPPSKDQFTKLLNDFNLDEEHHGEETRSELLLWANFRNCFSLDKYESLLHLIPMKQEKLTVYTLKERLQAELSAASLNNEGEKFDTIKNELMMKAFSDFYENIWASNGNSSHSTRSMAKFKEATLSERKTFVEKSKNPKYVKKKLTPNLSILGDFMVEFTCILEKVKHVNTFHVHILMAYLFALDVFNRSGLHGNPTFVGEAARGKSNIIHTVKKFFVPGTFVELSRTTAQAAYVGGHEEDLLIRLWDDMPPEQLGVLPGSRGQAGQTNNTGKEATEKTKKGTGMLTLHGVDMENGRKREEVKVYCDQCDIGCSNVNRYMIPIALETRHTIQEVVAEHRDDNGDLIGSIQKATAAKRDLELVNRSLDQSYQRLHCITAEILHLIYAGIMLPEITRLSFDVVVFETIRLAGARGIEIPVRDFDKCRMICTSLVVIEAALHVFHSPNSSLTNESRWDDKFILEVAPFLLSRVEHATIALGMLSFMWEDKTTDLIVKVLHDKFFKVKIDGVNNFIDQSSMGYEEDLRAFDSLGTRIPNPPNLTRENRVDAFNGSQSKDTTPSLSSYQPGTCTKYSDYFYVYYKEDDKNKRFESDSRIRNLAAKISEYVPDLSEGVILSKLFKLMERKAQFSDGRKGPVLRFVPNGILFSVSTLLQSSRNVIRDCCTQVLNNRYARSQTVIWGEVEHFRFWQTIDIKSKSDGMKLYYWNPLAANPDEVETIARHLNQEPLKPQSPSKSQGTSNPKDKPNKEHAETPIHSLFSENQKVEIVADLDDQCTLVHNRRYKFKNASRHGGNFPKPVSSAFLETVYSKDYPYCFKDYVDIVEKTKTLRSIS